MLGLLFSLSEGGIKVQRCAVVENANHTQTTGVNVVYYNAHQTPATEVDFFVSYHGTNYTLIDRGTFTHNAQINHTLNQRARRRGLAGRRARPLHAVARSVRNREDSRIA